jgi:hypothetical protein
MPNFDSGVRAWMPPSYVSPSIMRLAPSPQPNFDEPRHGSLFYSIGVSVVSKTEMASLYPPLVISRGVGGGEGEEACNGLRSEGR